jgi:CRP-like cAMP-binding protein
MLATLRQTAELGEFFRSNGVRHVFSKGDFISQPGQSLNGVFYISKGLVKAYTVTKYSEENLLIIRKQDEIFPLIWALTRQDNEIISEVIYQALVETEVWLVEREKFMKYVENDVNALTALLEMTVPQCS